jgi:hypothetical protein
MGGKMSSVFLPRYGNGVSGDFYRGKLSDIFYEWSCDLASAFFRDKDPGGFPDSWGSTYRVAADLLDTHDLRRFLPAWKDALLSLKVKRRKVVGLPDPWGEKIPEGFLIEGHMSFVDFVVVPRGYNMLVDVPDELAIKILTLGAIS